MFILDSMCFQPSLGFSTGTSTAVTIKLHDVLLFIIENEIFVIENEPQKPWYSL